MSGRDTSPRGHAPPETLQEVQHRLIVLVGEQVPELSPEQAEHALREARTWKGRAARELDAYLQERPTALSDPGVGFPISLHRLAKLLLTSGFEVTLPVCAGCGADQERMTLHNQRRLCTKCRPRRDPKRCARCGQMGRIAARRPEGGICFRCYRVDPQVTQPCAECGQSRMPVARRDNGQPVCERCWGRPQRKCSSCHTVDTAKALTAEGPLCPRCYRAQRARGECGICGEITQLARRSTDTQPACCYRCYRRPTQHTTCAFCLRQRDCQRLAGENWVCRTCTPKPKRPCGHCGTSRPIAATWPLGPVCQPCYGALRYGGRRCRTCSHVRPLTARDDAGTGICGPCADHVSPPPCRTCTNEDTFAHGECARCLLHGRLRDLLASPDGQISTQFAPLVNELISTPNPVRLLTWLQRTSCSQLLGRLAASSEPISHATLDALPASHDESYVRSLLVRTNVLPPRQESLDRVTPWLNRLLDERPTRHAQLLQPYVQWELLRKARRRGARGRSVDETGLKIRAEALLILEFLSWLDSRKLTLATLRQGHVEDWLDSGPARRHDLCTFLSWAHRQGLTDAHDITPVRRSPGSQVLSDDERWAQLRECLHSDALPLRVRVIRALTLLYGLPANQVRRLTAADIQQRGNDTHLRLRNSNLFLPPRLADLVNELASTTREEPLLPPSAPAQQWLFPGNIPGQPMSIPGFSLLMRRHGFHVQPARIAALVALAEKLPAPVLAQLLGISIDTAHKWAAYTQPNWSAYLAARDHETRPRPKE